VQVPVNRRGPAVSLSSSDSTSSDDLSDSLSQEQVEIRSPPVAPANNRVEEETTVQEEQKTADQANEQGGDAETQEEQPADGADKHHEGRPRFNRGRGRGRGGGGRGGRGGGDRETEEERAIREAEEEKARNSISFDSYLASKQPLRLAVANLDLGGKKSDEEGAQGTSLAGPQEQQVEEEVEEWEEEEEIIEAAHDEAGGDGGVLCAMTKIFQICTQRCTTIHAILFYEKLCGRIFFSLLIPSNA
jgi:hypothetical protein